MRPYKKHGKLTTPDGTRILAYFKEGRVLAPGVHDQVIGSYSNGKVESTRSDGEAIGSYGSGEIHTAGLISRHVANYGGGRVRRPSWGGDVVGTYSGEDAGAAAATLLTILARAGSCEDRGDVEGPGGAPFGSERILVYQKGTVSTWAVGPLARHLGRSRVIAHYTDDHVESELLGRRKQIARLSNGRVVAGDEAAWHGVFTAGEVVASCTGTALFIEESSLGARQKIGWFNGTEVGALAAAAIIARAWIEWRLDPRSFARNLIYDRNDQYSKVLQARTAELLRCHRQQREEDLAECLEHIKAHQCVLRENVNDLETGDLLVRETLFAAPLTKDLSARKDLIDDTLAFAAARSSRLVGWLQVERGWLEAGWFEANVLRPVSEGIAVELGVQPAAGEEPTGASQYRKASGLAASNDDRRAELGAMLDIAVACSSAPAAERAAALARAYHHIGIRYGIGPEWELPEDYGETYRIVTDAVPVESHHLSVFMLASATLFDPRILSLLSRLDEDQLATISPIRDALLTIRALHHFSHEQVDEAIEDLSLQASREPVYPANLASSVVDLSGHDPRIYPALVQLSRYTVSASMLVRVLILLRRGRLAERYFAEHAPEPDRSVFRRLLHVQQRVTTELCSGSSLYVREPGPVGRLMALLTRVGREQRRDVIDTRHRFIDLIQGSMEADPDPYIAAFATIESARVQAALSAMQGAIAVLEELVRNREDNGCFCAALEYLAFLYAARGERQRAREAIEALFRWSVLSEEREAHRAEEDIYIGYGGKLGQLSYFDNSGEIQVRIEQNRRNVRRAVREHGARVRADAEIPSHSRIPPSHHLRPALNREILNRDCALPPVSLNRAEQIWPKSGREECEVLSTPTLSSANGTGHRDA